MKENLLLLKDYLGPQKKKNYEYMTSVPKNMYIERLDYIIKNYNNTYHGTIKMKPVDVK